MHHALRGRRERAQLESISREKFGISVEIMNPFKKHCAPREEGQL